MAKGMSNTLQRNQCLQSLKHERPIRPILAFHGVGRHQDVIHFCYLWDFLGVFFAEDPHRSVSFGRVSRIGCLQGQALGGWSGIS